MTNEHTVSRRTALGAIAAGATALTAVGAPSAQAQAGGLKSNLKQSACRWCYRKIELDELCRNAAEIGLKSVELLDVDEISVPAKYGLTCALANGPSGIARGWNRAEDHGKLIDKSKDMIPKIADAGVKSMILFSGNTGALTPEQGLENCAKGVSKILKVADKHDVTVCMELLNSKIDHRDYQCDNTPWGVALVEKIGDERFKLLYDIYHMQIMEGDVIRTIRDNAKYFHHYHTGGVPGRHEIDDTQELNYTTVCKAIVETGYQGYLGQEFIPTRDPMTSLREAAHICDV